VVAVQVNPKDVTGQTTGFFRGIAQVINGACQRIDDPAVVLAFGATMLSAQTAPLSDNVVQGVSKLRDDAGGASDGVTFADSVLINNSPQLTQEHYLTVRAGGDNAPVSAEVVITNT